MPPTSPHVRALTDAALAALALGAFSTFGDWIWARYIPDGAVLPGVLHGVLFFALIALVLGAAARAEGATRRFLLTLPLAGLVLAAAFYPLAHLLGYLGALLATWVGMWLALALLQRWARRGRERTGVALARGLVAAVGSGVAFWLVSGMWTDPNFAFGYPVRLVFWTLAFLPGLAALFWPLGGLGPERAVKLG